jgi:hypothetical protein
MPGRWIWKVKTLWKAKLDKVDFLVAFMALRIAVQNSRWNVRSIIAKFPIDLKEFNCLDPACPNKNEHQMITVRI